MSGLLPSTPDTSAADEPDPRVIGLDSDDASALIAALSSKTARSILAALHENPSTPSTLAARVDTSLQNAQYHLRKLEAANLIEEIDTCYSEKGREMSVYAPADRPLVVFAGREEQALGLKSALATLVGGIGILGFASVIVERLLTDGISPRAVQEEMEPTMDVADEPGVEQTPTPSPDGIDAWFGAVSGVVDIVAASPGALFFLGGVTMLLALFTLWVVYNRRD